MDARVTEALAFMVANSSAVNSHAGAAYPEGEILKRLANGTASGATGLFGDAMLNDLQRGVMSVPDRAHTYKLSHAILFSSDFGRQPITGIDQSGYEAMIESLVQSYIEDTDVLGELLMCAKCIGYWSSNLTAAMTHFESLWNALDRNNFAENYHQILVGGLLFSME